MSKKQATTDRDTDSAVASRGGGVPKTEETYSPLVTLRRTIFPIYGPQEVIKFLLIGTIKFFIIMALTLTRDTKDTLVVTQCGAEAIAFLKVGYVGVYKSFCTRGNAESDFGECLLTTSGLPPS